MATKSKTKNKPGPKFFNPTEKERVLADVARLLGFKYTQAEVAVKVGVSPAMVSNYAKQLRERYAKTQFSGMAELVSEKVAQYDEVIRQAAAAFERSKTRVVTDEDGNEESVATTPEAVFLAKVMDALKAQRELLGLDAPTKSDVRQASVNVNVGPAVPDWGTLSGRPPRSDLLAEAVEKEQTALPAHEPGKNGTDGRANGKPKK